MKSIYAYTLIIAAATLTACGGGGGGSTGGGGGVSVTPTVAPTTTATSTPTPVPQQVTGTVADLGTQRFSGDTNGTAGAAIAGATVVVGPTLIVGATPPPTLPTGDASAVTSASGAYSITGATLTGTTYVMVFPASTDTSHISLHALAKVTSNAIRPLYLYAMDAEDVAELAQVNTDRTSNGAGTVIPDEIAFETARAHATFMATTGYVQHCIPASNCYVNSSLPTTPPASYAPQYASPDDLYNYLDGAKPQTPGINSTENWYYSGYSYPGGTFPNVGWPTADAAFMSEKTQSPPGGHYTNIVNTAHVWVGLGDVYGGVPAPPDPGYTSAIFIQEFY